MFTLLSLFIRIIHYKLIVIMIFINAYIMNKAVIN